MMKSLFKTTLLLVILCVCVFPLYQQTFAQAEEPEIKEIVEDSGEISVNELEEWRKNKIIGQEDTLQTQLFEKERLSVLAKRLYDGVMAHETTVYVGDLGIPFTDDWSDPYYEAMDSDPVAYYAQTWPCSLIVNIGYTDNKEIIDTYQFSFRETKEEYTTRYNELQDAITETLIASVNDTMNEQEKALAIHDYLAKTIAYGGDDHDDQTPYGALVEKKCVCGGYSATYGMLLGTQGINTIQVTTPQTDNHAWTLVQLDNEWYHVDVTWDDPQISWNSENHGDTPGFVRNLYFLRNDEEMTALRKSRDWGDDIPKSTSTTYSQMPRSTMGNQAYMYETHHWYSTTDTPVGGGYGTLRLSDFYGKNSIDIQTRKDLYGVEVIGRYVYYGVGGKIYCIQVMSEEQIGGSMELVYSGNGDAYMGLFYTLDGKMEYACYSGGYYYIDRDAISLNLNEQKLEDLTLTPTVSTLALGERITLVPGYSPIATTDAKNIQWESSNPTVATVNNGIVLAEGIGNATITASAGSFSKQCMISVIGVPQLTLDYYGINLVAGEGAQTITATLNPSDQSAIIEWESSDSGVATVKDGVVTPVSKGSAEITVTYTGIWGVLKEKCRVNVEERSEFNAVDFVAIDVTGKNQYKGECTIDEGDYIALKAHATGGKEPYSYEFSYQLNGKTTVINDYYQWLYTLFIPTQNGTYTLISRIKDANGRIIEQEMQLKINIKPKENPTNPLKSITLNQTNIELDEGNTKTLTVTYNPEDTTDDKTVTWTSSNSKIATVSQEGVVKGIASGDVTITATCGSQKATCAVKVNKPVIKVQGIKLDQTETTLIRGSSITLKATVSPDNATNKNITWTSSNPKVATVTQEGVVKGIAKGIAAITCSAKDGSGCIATCTVTVQINTNVWNGTADTSWYQSTGTSFQIDTPEKLAGLSKLVNAGNTFENKKITLTKDIYLNDTGLRENEWVPIAYVDDANHTFEGFFDGAGHTIYNPYLSQNGKEGGLFGTIGSKGIVRAVKMGEGTIEQSGSIATVNNGIIAFCENYSDIYGSGYIPGGICAMNRYLVYGCYNEGWVSSGGGIVGSNLRDSSSNVSAFVDSCWNAGSVYRGAGIVEGNHPGGWVYDCLNTGEIEVDGAGIVKVENNASGIDTRLAVTNCYNIGKLVNPGYRQFYPISPASKSQMNCYAIQDNDNLPSELKQEAMVKKLNGNSAITKWQSGRSGVNSGMALPMAQLDRLDGLYKILPDIWGYGRLEYEVDLSSGTLHLDDFKTDYASAITYTSSNPDILTVNGQEVTLKKEGEANVVATFAETEINKKVSLQYKITITNSALLGDVNADGQINASDALQDLRHSVKEITLEGTPFLSGDVNKDKIINASDALQILRYSVKEINKFE